MISATRDLRRHSMAATALTFLLVIMVGGAGCNPRTSTDQAAAPPSTRPSTPPSAAGREAIARSSPRHDLSVDEAMGGHTLARHVGKSDEELAARLRREPNISSASTYTDRVTAEDIVGAALSSGGRSFDAWRRRSGRRPNFVLHFAAGRVIGRSIARGHAAAVPCEDALVVLRWDDRRQQFYVLTSYPEEHR